MGGWIHESLVELGKTLAHAVDRYAKAACWIERTTHDPYLP